MKKAILLSGLVFLSYASLFAQGKKNSPESKQQVELNPPASSLKVENMAFTTDVHDFGTVPEGPTADYEFSFKNTGKEPIVLSKVQASCGCTTPSYSKEPVPPGQEGKIHVTYNTKGRPNAFTKSITVVSNAGTKILTIKGTVEKAPATSAPENNSMLKTNQ
jgi:Protein of unknown function (DUF1573)